MTKKTFILLVTTLTFLTQIIFAEGYIKKGDIIDIIAPSYGCSTEELSKIKTKLTALGYQPRISPNLLNPTYLSYSNQNTYRLNDLKRALSAEDSNIIWVVRGGYGAQELLDELKDFPQPQHPKLLIGYSDTTYLHLFLNQKWGWKSLHASTLKFNQDIDPKVNKEESITSVTRFLEAPHFSYPLTPLNAAAKQNQTIKTQIIGGNLSVILANMGTFNEIDTRNKILFFEDVGEAPQKLKRNLLTLQSAGKLDEVEAILIGDFANMNQALTQKIIQDLANSIEIPCYKSNLFGHGDLNKPLPLHQVVILESTGEKAILKSN